MNTPLATRAVLAYSGSVSASAAIAWLARHHRADVVTVSLDLGQDRPVAELRDRALACGASRAHVIDARDQFASECVIPSLRIGAGAKEAGVQQLAWPLLAAKLVEVARIEGTDLVAHTSQEPGFHASLVASGLRVVNVTAELAQAGITAAEYARQHGLPISTRDGDGADEAANLLVRPPARRPSADEAAQVELAFENAVPVSINGVPLSPAELLASLALIAAQHGIGAAAPAALVLRSAYAALREPAGIVRLKLSRGEHTVLDAHPALVNYA